MVASKRFTDIFGERDDFFFAGSGNNVITSSNGSDVIFAGPGDDTLMVFAREGDVFVFGGKGDDTIAVLGDGLCQETEGRFTVITDDDGFRLVIKGVESVVVYDI